MDPQTSGYFANIVSAAKEAFRQVEHTTDSTPERAILRLHATYGRHRVFVTELLSGDVRQYRYYLLLDDWVVAGFDNSPDPRAIRLKYGQVGAEHAGELMPHLHERNKAHLRLTDNMSFFDFLRWLENNVMDRNSSR